jgi:protein-S-isoprenylcysteine O-methyltransferase Ste14
MSLKYFIVVIIFTLYFYLGSFPEEKKLELEYGEEYQSYKKQTPRIFPWPWRKKFFTAKKDEKSRLG